MKQLSLTIGCLLLIAVLVIQYQTYEPLGIDPGPTCAAGEPADADYMVYRKVLLNRVRSEVGDRKTILVLETVDASDYEIQASANGHLAVKDPSYKGDGDISNTVVGNFIRSSSSIVDIEPDHFRDLDIVFSSKAEIDDLFSEGISAGWRAVGNSSIYRFSRVGFSCSGNQALVYVSMSCGGLCGRGSLVALEKQNGEWEETLVEGLWIS
jgi:hypothetical protein